jgi:hypothetical protein
MSLTAAAHLRGYRNGLNIVPYAYRGRSYSWAQRVLAAAEAEHGRPGNRPSPTAEQMLARADRIAAKQRAYRERRQAAAAG